MRKLALTLMLGSGAAGLWATDAPARPLTSAESKVCTTAKACADIALRHRPSAFDYDVLASEFARLSPAAGQAMVRGAKPGQFANILRLAERSRPEVALLIGLDLAASDDPAKRAVAAQVFELDAVRAMRLKPGKRAPLPTLLRMSAERPGLLVTRMLAQHPTEAARPGLIAALASEDATTVATAYEAMFADNPQTAFTALVAHMRAVDSLPNAVAIGQMIAARDAARADGFYARMLDDIANDAGYPQAMRDGMRAGSFALARSDAPLTLSADMAGQIGRLHAARLLPEPRDAMARGDAATRQAWLVAARTEPALLDAVLRALPADRMSEAEVAAWIDAGLRDPRRADSVLRATALMPLYAVDRWADRLSSLAKTHPFDAVRAAARRKLERLPGEAVDAGDLRRERSTRGEAAYCVDGESVAPNPPFAIMPMFEEEAIRAQLDRSDLVTSYPALTRWLAGYETGGLVAFDYADGKPSVITRGRVDLMTPNVPPPIGQQPDHLWVFHASESGTLVVSRVAPDESLRAEFAHSLPAPVTRAFRLEDDSLLLHFHDMNGPFQPALDGNRVVPGWVDSHPPLRLSPDGALVQGCRPDALAGGRPDATP